MEVVYFYNGKLPEYTIDSIYNTRLFHNGKITLLCDEMESPHLNEIKKMNVNIIDSRNYNDLEFIQTIQININKMCIPMHLPGREYLFIRSLERFFILRNYMITNKLENILFLELDMLIYFKPDDMVQLFSQRELTLSYIDENMVSSAFFYVRSIHILNDLKNYFLNFIQNAGPGDFISEMVGFYKWIQIPENKARTWMIPGIWKEPKYKSETWEEFDTFGKTIYDGLGVAIAVDGPDWMHKKQWEEKNKVWWGNHVKYNEYIYKWKEISGYKYLYLCDENNNEYKCQCLHIHNKNIKLFMARQIINIDECMPVRGELFVFMAGAVLRKKGSDEYYEVVGWDKKNLVYFEDIPENWSNPNIVFCNTDDIDYLVKYIDRFQNKFVLITHNSDKNIDKEYTFLATHPKVAHWFTQNLCDNIPNTTRIPIGFANYVWAHGKYEISKHVHSLNVPKTNMIYANFLIETNRLEREKCLNTLIQKNIPIHGRTNYYEYCMHLASSQFCICPEGNGKDTHRFWEALYFKSIPIVLRSYLTEQLAKEYPCILLNNWEELSPEMLQYNPEVFTNILEIKSSFNWVFQEIKKILNT